MDDYKLLDTSAFDAFIAKRTTILSKYDELDKQYDSIVKTLLEKWKGRGADAFSDDAQKVKSNIAGIGDMMQSMCDYLEDYKDTYLECDSALGTKNGSII